MDGEAPQRAAVTLTAALTAAVVSLVWPEGARSHESLDNTQAIELLRRPDQPVESQRAALAVDRLGGLTVFRRDWYNLDTGASQRLKQRLKLVDLRLKLGKQLQNVVICNIPLLLAQRDQAWQSLGIRRARGCWLVF